MTFIDTADVYGDGRSERLVGRFLAERPDAGLFVATKMGRRVEQRPEHYTLDNFRAWNDRSRENLGVETLDLVQLHCPPTPVYADDAVFDALDALVDGGAHPGLRRVGRDGARRRSRRSRGRRVASVQIILNAFRLKPLERVLPAARGGRRRDHRPRPARLRAAVAASTTSTPRSTPTTTATTTGTARRSTSGETFSGVPFEVGLAAVRELRGWSARTWPWPSSRCAGSSTSRASPPSSRAPATPSRREGNVAAAALPRAVGGAAGRGARGLRPPHPRRTSTTAGSAVEPEELAAAIKALSEWAERNAPQPESKLRVRVRDHLGVDPGGLEVVNEELSAYDHVNVQVALDALAEATGEAPEILGLSLEHGWRVGLTELAQGSYGGMTEPGPVEYVQIDVGDRVVSCLKSALLLVRDGEDRLVVLLAPPEEPGEGGLALQAMAPRRAIAEAWLARLRALMQEHNVYRGKVVAFGGSHPFHPAPLTVRVLPRIARGQIVLPDIALERIERHTAGLAKHRDRLRATGRHVKRGLLLHGPPGTGKTMTVMYLAGLMPERTVVLLTGEALAAVTPACALARSLEPAMVVLEDVDLIARHRAHFQATPFLFELLNAMDGLDEDADLIFVLTTNRAKDLEPALASRPGRIDLAVELPLPDAHARRRLLALYGEGLPLEVADWEPVVAATEGTSPAFIRELFRRAALIAAEEDDGASVTPETILEAVAELKDRSGRLTATLLGAAQPEDDEEDEDEEGGWSAG